MLLKNGYTVNAIKYIFQIHLRNQTNNEMYPQKTYKLIYITRSHIWERTEKVARFLREQDMDITFKPSYPSQNTLEMQEQEPTEVIIRRYINQHVELTPIHI